MREIKSIYGKDCKKVLWTKQFKHGYILQRELITLGYPEGCEMTVAYNFEDEYIGDSKTAYRLCVKRGIYPQKSSNGHNVCSIGFCSKDNKWYGWSHRAIYGFGIGYKSKIGNCGNEYLPRNFEVKNLLDAKRCAIAFANSVS